MPPSLLLLLSCLLVVYCSRRTPLSSHPGEDQGNVRRKAENRRSPKALDDTGCVQTDVTGYTGNASTTESGLTCQMWSVNSPHNHTYTGVGDHNYCRSPDGDSKLWCYTLDPGKLREYCNVPVCMTNTKGMA